MCVSVDSDKITDVSIRILVLAFERQALLLRKEELNHRVVVLINEDGS